MRTRDSAIQSRMTPWSASGLPKATRPLGALAHQLDGALGDADRAHAVVDAAGAEPGLGDARSRRPPRRSGCVAGTRTSVKPQLGVATVFVVVVAEDVHAADDLDARGCHASTRIIDCWRCRSATGSVLPMTMKIWQLGFIAPVIHHLRPLMTYSSPSRTIDSADVGGVGGGDVGLGHRERRPDVAVQQRAAASAPSARPCRTCASTSMLPVSGAAQFSAAGRGGCCDRRSRRAARTAGSSGRAPCSPGRKRFHSPRARACVAQLLQHGDRVPGPRVVKGGAAARGRPPRRGRRARP